MKHSDNTEMSTAAKLYQQNCRTAGWIR